MTVCSMLKLGGTYPEFSVLDDIGCCICRLLIWNDRIRFTWNNGKVQSRVLFTDWQHGDRIGAWQDRYEHREALNVLAKSRSPRQLVNIDCDFQGLPTTPGKLMRFENSFSFSISSERSWTDLKMRLNPLGLILWPITTKRNVFSEDSQIWTNARKCLLIKLSSEHHIEILF